MVVVQVDGGEIGRFEEDVGPSFAGVQLLQIVALAVAVAVGNVLQCVQ